MAEQGPTLLESHPVEAQGSPKEPARKKARQEPRKVKIQFKAPGRKSCEIAIYGFWLSSSEFFEAKFERWTKEGDPQTEPLVLDLPQGCQPEKGAVMLKRRLAAAEVDEEADWDSVKWWRAVQGDEEALFAAVCVFDLLLMPIYSKEVADALYDFRLDCPMDVGAIAVRYNRSVACCERKPATAGDAVVSVWGNYTSEAVSAWYEVLKKGAGHPAVQQLVDRAVYGSGRCQRGCHLTMMVELCLWCKLQPVLRTWVEGHLKRLLGGLLQISDTCVQRIKEAAATKDTALACVCVLLHTLFIESSRGRCGSKQQEMIVASIRKLSETASPEFDASVTRQNASRSATAVLKSNMSMPVLAVAAVGAQGVFVEALGEGAGKFLHGHTHLLHPENRWPLLKHIEDLSQADIECLSATTFPQQEVESESESEEGDDDE